MYLNSLKPTPGSRKPAKRRGRGIGSGLGKTGGRGHKGQKSRSGGFHKVGFRSAVNRHTVELRLYQINAIDADVIDLETLKKAGVIGQATRKVRLVNTGSIERAVTVRGVHVTAGAVKAIEAAGGKVE